jgi:hypothetical protein
MRSPRGILTVLAAAALLAVAAVVAYGLLWPRLPDPRVADREGLFRWLVLRDLSEESLETQQILAERLEGELQAGLDCRSTTGRLDDAQRQRLWNNILVLLEPWFIGKVDTYYTLPGAERAAYLDQFIAAVSAWQGVDALRPPQADPPQPGPGNGGLIGLLLTRIDQWKAGADGQQKDRIHKFVAATETRWLAVHDLSKESPQARQSLARRLDTQLQGNFDWQSAAGQLTDAQRQRLWENVLLLLEPWFMDKVDHYFTLAGSERVAYLDRLLDKVTALRGVEALFPGQHEPTKVPGQQAKLVGVLLDQVEKWKAAADPQRKERIGEFVAAVQIHWLMRELPRLSPAPR